MRVKLIRTYGEFQSLRDSWNSLLGASQSNTLFLTWEWMDAWLRNNNNTSIFTSLYFDDEKLVGIAPFYIGKLKLLNLLSLKTLRSIGDTNSGFEYPSIIAMQGFEKTVCDSVANFLVEHKTEWDCIWLPSCSAWDGMAKMIEKSFLNYRQLKIQNRSSLFSCLELPISFDGYLAKFSRNRRNSLRRTEKKFDSLEDISLESCTNEEDVSHYLNDLYRLHHLRWSELGEVGSFVKLPALCDFYEKFALLALHRGWLRLTKITHNGETKAIQIGYVYEGSYFQLQEGFDPKFHENIGNYLRIKTIRTFIEEGVNCYDFLGGFSEHKRRWKAEPREGLDLFICNWKLRTFPFYIASIWPTGRFVREFV